MSDQEAPPHVTYTIFPFDSSDDFDDLTEKDYSRAEADVDYLLPLAAAARKGAVERLSRLPFALQNHESDFIEENYEPRRHDWRNYTNHTTTETLLQYRAKLEKSQQLSKLELLLDLPIDILRLIFDQLHPIDLYHLSRASRLVRTFLCHKDSRTLWKNLFTAWEDLPECPPDFIEPRWAAFLFGDDECDMCRGRQSSPEFYLRRRLCEPCLMANTVPAESDAGVAFTLLPKSWSEDRFWKADIEAAELELQTLTARLEAQDPTAQVEMEIFTDSKTALLMLINEVDTSSMIFRWGRNLKYDHESRQEKKTERVVDSLKRRFKTVGHQPEDCDDASISVDEDEKYSHRYLTKQQFEFLRPKYEPEVLSAKERRLVREHEQAVSDRSDKICEVFKELTRKHPAWIWGYQPHYHHVHDKFSIFTPLINAPGSEPIPEEQLAHAMEEVEKSLLEQWRWTKMKELVKLIPPGTTPTGSASTDTTAPDLDSLELATTIFTCDCEDNQSKPRCFVGWDEVGEHMCCCDIVFSSAGSATAAALVALVGLEPAKTSATTLDRRNDRFICGSCPLESVPRSAGVGGGAQGRKAMNWRDAVLHTVHEASDSEHCIPQWLLLSTDAARDIKAREKHPEFDSDQWACCHCPHNWLEHDDNRPVVKEHLREVHDINRPVETLDFVLYEKYRRPRGGHALLPDIPLYRCNLCPHLDRLYTKDQIAKHVQRKGHVAVKPGEETSEIKAIERVTMPPPSTTLVVEQPAEAS